LKPENQVKKSIKDLLAYLHIFNFHVLQGLGSRRGICDRIAIYKGQFIAIETKAKGRKPSEAQVEFLREVEEAGGISIVAYSPDDIIEALGLQDRFLDLK